MIVAKQTNYLDRFKDGLSFVVHPILVAVDFPRKTYLLFIEKTASHADLLDENRRLKVGALMLNAKMQKFDAMEKENTRLHNLLESSFKLGEQFVAASLIGVNLNPSAQLITIDKGGRFDLFEGQAAINADGVIGQIVNVNPLTSSIMLITDLNHAIPIEINRTGHKSIALGLGLENELSVLHLPHNIDVKEGDLLTTSGLGGVFPKGYPVARVSKITPLPGEAFMRVEAQTIAKIETTHELLMVWNNREPIPLLPKETTKPKTSIRNVR